MRGALREDPDILLVGEMRDLETIELALTAAATGHLVFGTLHTSSAAKAVDRVIDVFPADQQNQIRTTLAESLKGVIAQNLFKRIDKPGRVAALEILVVDMAIANLVREGKTHQIPGMIQVGKKKGNQPLDDAIMDHLRHMRISPEEAYDKAIDKKKFRPFLKIRRRTSSKNRISRHENARSRPNPLRDAEDVRRHLGSQFFRRSSACRSRTPASSKPVFVDPPIERLTAVPDRANRARPYAGKSALDARIICSTAPAIAATRSTMRRVSASTFSGSRDNSRS